MTKLRMGLALVAVVLAAGGRPLHASGEELNLSRYGALIDFSNDTGPNSAFLILDENAIVERCRDHDGCTFTLKLDGPQGIVSTTERVYLSGYSLAYTTTSTLTPAPLVDGDGSNGILATVAMPGGPPFAVCTVTDQDTNSSSADTTEGFLLDFTVTQDDRAWVCVLHVDD